MSSTHGSLSYFTAVPGRNNPVAKLVPPRREGIARMLLPTADYDWPDHSLRVVQSSQAGDAFGTIVILTETSNTGEALKLVRASLNGAAV